MALPQILIYPTDTVWGIGVSAHTPRAASIVNNIKKAQENKPVSLIFSSLDMVKDYFKLPYKTLSLFKKLDGMEFTLGLPVSKLQKEIDPSVYGSSNFIGVRLLE